MKTFKQFILEAEDITLLDLVQNDCRLFLKERGNSLLYRGLSGSSLGTPAGKVKIGEHLVDYYVKTVRTDRLPASSPRNVHDIVDEWFSNNFDVKARSQSMFAYGEGGILDASSYGKLCAVFPIGGFDYIWSPEINDLFKDMDAEDINKYSDDDEIRDYMDNINYKKTKDLKKALESDSEIMVLCKSYYAIPCPKPEQRELIKNALQK